MALLPYVLGAAVFFNNIISIHADGTCTTQNPNSGVVTCATEKIDLSTIFCADFDPARCQSPEPGQNWIYYFTIAAEGIPIAWQTSNLNCGSGLGNPWSNASVIQYDSTRSDQNCYLASSSQPPALTSSSYTYTSDSNNKVTSVSVELALTPTSGTQGRQTTLVVQCSNVNNITYSTKEDTGVYTITAVAKCSGPAPHPSMGSSAGWILVGIFFGGVLVYAIAGFVYNLKVKDLKGKEALPHREFWLSLPGLVKDGFGFCKHKILRRGDDYVPL